VIEGVLDGFFIGVGLIEHLDEGGPREVLENELAAVVVKVPHGRNRESGFSGSHQQTGFADHSPNPQSVVEVGVPPRSRPSLLSYRFLAEPLAHPNLGFGPQVKALCGFEDHDPPTVR
jgi:hypothetical protein